MAGMAMAAAEQGEAIRRYYATDRNLRILEETYAQYCVPRTDFVNWTLDAIGWAGDEAVLDIGVGTGSHYACLLQRQPGISYFAVDLSPYLLSQHPCNAGRLAYGDALRLPYSDNAFDVVMANHVLYHVADVDSCLREIKRVLKPDGRLLASTDSLQTTPELQVLIRRAIILLSDNGSQVQPLCLPCDAFALENGTRILARHFYAVVRHDLPGILTFDAVDPALEYLESMRDLRQHDLPANVSWDDMMLIMHQQMTQLLQLLGKLEINIGYGALVASDCGDFINEFVTCGQRETET